jgi:zinc-ribbon domain
MFCPKCGTENPESGKFCRNCGADLGNVAAALSGTLRNPQPAAAPQKYYLDHKGRMKSNDPADLFAGGLRSVIMGFGFLAVAVALFLTNVAGGKVWWWTMLIPGFSMLAKGVSDIARANRLEAKTRTAPEGSDYVQQTPLSGAAQNTGLPPVQTNYVDPESRFKTGDLVPPSVTDGTTRHLKMDDESKTMTLPKK